MSHFQSLSHFVPQLIVLSLSDESRLIFQLLFSIHQTRYMSITLLHKRNRVYLFIRPLHSLCPSEESQYMHKYLCSFQASIFLLNLFPVWWLTGQSAPPLHHIPLPSPPLPPLPPLSVITWDLTMTVDKCLLLVYIYPVSTLWLKCCTLLVGGCSAAGRLAAVDAGVR